MTLRHQGHFSKTEGGQIMGRGDDMLERLDDVESSTRRAGSLIILASAANMDCRPLLIG